MEAENTQPRFAICINTGSFVDDLKMRTVYLVINGGDCSATFLVLQGIGEYDYVSLV